MILIDLALGHKPLAGLSFIRRLRLVDPTILILVFSMHDDPLIAGQALKIGANGYLVKDASAEEIVNALAAVARRPSLSQSGARLRDRLHGGAKADHQPDPLVNRAGA